MHAAAPLMFALGLIALLYGAFIAFTEDDAKRIMAYSSLSHLGLILIAIFSFNPIALAGAAVYIIAHGLFSASGFLTLGFIEEREETRSLSHLGGLCRRQPAHERRADDHARSPHSVCRVSPVSPASC